jgi:multidrug efflux pump
MKHDQSNFNLTALALRNQQVTLFFILVIAIAGISAYFKLGQREDPDFTFRAMVIRTIWPGATTEQVDQQITDRLEKKLQEVPYYKWTRTYSKPGESLVILELVDTAPRSEVPQIWYQVRKKLGDIKQSLPAEALGPFYNDEFGDVFGSIYAFTGEGYSLAEIKEQVENTRQQLMRIPNISKIELIGTQSEKIFIDISSQKLALLFLDANQIINQLTAQNVIAPAGTIEGQQVQLPVRVSGQFDSVETIRNMPLQVAGKTLRLSDIGHVYRGYSSPPATGEYAMRYQGKPAIGLAISMKSDGDVLKLGDDLKREMALIAQNLPAGISFGQVSDQPRIVKQAVGEFTSSLVEAILIVLAVSFLSLGVRTGLVVALTIPFVMGATFLAMRYFNIDLHRISTGALIIALGLLVDDAIIAVEMMARKIEEGFSKFNAATYAYTSTAFPMLTGTLIMAAGFLPIATAKSTTGEYTIAIFQVVTIALLISWLAAVIVTPMLGMLILVDRDHQPNRFMAAAAKFLRLKPAVHHDEDSVFDTRFYRGLRSLITTCIRFRWVTIAVTIGLFVLGGIGMGLTQKQFFPTSDRAEFIVEMWLPEGASFTATEREAKRLEAILATNKDIQSYVTYIGNGSPRFFLSLDQQLLRSNFAQIIGLTADVKAAEATVKFLEAKFAAEFPDVRGRVYRVPLGPPVNYPIQFRVMGSDIAALKATAELVTAKIRANPATANANVDWGDRVPALRVQIDQDKARALGVNSQAVARTLGSAVSGGSIGQLRESDKLIDVVLRSPQADRQNPAALAQLLVATSSGRFVPIGQFATVETVLEEPIVWRRSRELSLTARADLLPGFQAPDIAMQINPTLDEIRAKLPPGIRVEIGGAFEENVKAQASINAGGPFALALVTMLLMLQLRRFSTTFMVLLTAPLGIIGVAAALLAANKPLGFVAFLGVIALAGMIMRNTVILVEQIQQNQAAGSSPFDAILEAAIRRFRPICLTAAAAVFAMVPLARSVLWGPMAYAIMGGLVVATVLTVLFVPALYATWNRVKS